VSESGYIEVEERNGAIIVTLSNSENEIYSILPPQQAQDVAEAIAKHAYHAQTGRTELSKKIMQSNFNTKMLTRITNRIKRGQEKSELPGYTAADILNMVWTEVT